MDVSLSRLGEMVEDREPGVLQSMGLLRVRYNLATEKQQIQADPHPKVLHLIMSAKTLSANKIPSTSSGG